MKAVLQKAVRRYSVRLDKIEYREVFSLVVPFRIALGKLVDSRASDRAGRFVDVESIDESCQPFRQPRWQRRKALFGLAILFALIYLPRVPRLKTYLMVSGKGHLVLESAVKDSGWHQHLERYLAGFEAWMRTPSDFVQGISTHSSAQFNDWLETRNCPSAQVNAYVQARMAKTIPLSLNMERRCGNAIRRAMEHERDLLGLTEDGRIRVAPSDIIFLAGDSLMQGPATQISVRLKSQGLRVVDASRVSTGLAYPQFFDWVARIKKAILEDKINVLVVFLGANDTFDMFDGGLRLALGSKEWENLYSSRISEISLLAKQNHVPLIWLGMPAMNRSDIQPYVPAMNRLFADVVGRHGGIYLPTGEVLGESEAKYVSVKLKDGRRLATRADDGVHFTPLGWSLVADVVLQKFSFD